MENLLVPGVATQSLPGTRILVLAPHPDDEVFGCGGAIMRHVAKGEPVRVIIVTDGGWGVAPELRAGYVAQRREESTAAARILGYGTPEFWGREDRALQYGEKLVQEILAAITAAGADLVYAPCVLEMHPDHRALAIAAVEAVRRCGDAVRLAQYEIGIPLRPNLLLDISDLAARKLEAMQCFASQLTRQRYDLDVAALNRFRSFTLPAEVSAAEAYAVASGAELAQDPLGLYQSEHSRQRALGLALDSRDYPLVSVIVRSMDRASLADALDSIALQTYPNIEVVVVNAKGDAHRKLDPWCGRYPLRVIESGSPLERAAACNRGLDAAQGELLIFLDDDDLFLPHHVGRLREELERHPEAVGAYASVLGTDAGGKEIRRFAEEFDPLKLAIGNFIPIHAMLFRRDVVRKGARFDEALPVCEDWDFWLQLHLQGMFRFVPEDGAIYRMRVDAGSQVWVDQDKSTRVMLQIYRKRMPGWNDKILWGIFEWARYKPLYVHLAATHARLQQESSERAASDGARMQQLLQEQAQERANVAASNAALNAELAQRDKLVAQRDDVIAQRGEVIAQRDAAIKQRDSMIAGRAAEIAALRTALEQNVLALEERDVRIATIHASTSWRITKPLRRVVSFLRGQPAAQSDAVVNRTVPVTQSSQHAQPQPQLQPAQPLARPQQPQVAGDGVTNYDYEAEITGENAAAFVCQLTGKDKRVLEVGCGPGSITKLLQRHCGCRVTGLELEEASIERARQYCEAIHQADLNSDNWPQLLGSAKGFDTVVAADVLEHLYDPWKTLRQMATLISPSGNIVVSLPHAGHAVIAGCLFNGDLAYGKWGLLDRTHIRFFGLRNIEELFAQAELKIIEARYVIKAPEETELNDQWQRLPESVRDALKLNKYFNIYQVVVKAVPLDRPDVAIALT